MPHKKLVVLVASRSWTEFTHREAMAFLIAVEGRTVCWQSIGVTARANSGLTALDIDANEEEWKG
jgi:hypothetical protein